MISVNATGGAVWPHWWHGAFVAESEWPPGRLPRPPGSRRGLRALVADDEPPLITVVSSRSLNPHSVFIQTSPRASIL